MQSAIPLKDDRCCESLNSALCLTPPKGASPNTVVGTGPAGRRHLREAAFKKTLVWVTGMAVNSYFTELFRGFGGVETSYWSRVQTTFLLVERKEASKKRVELVLEVAAQRRQIWIEIGARSGSEALNVEDIRQSTQTTLSIKLSLDTNDQK